MICLYRGRRGTGKTLTMVKDVLLYTQNKWNVISNIHLADKIPHQVLSRQEIIELLHSDLRDYVLVLDEIQTIIDSRRSMKKDNMDFSYFIQQIRKKNIILLATTQYTRTVDIRFREHVDILVSPKFIQKYPIVEVEYMDLTTQEDLGYIQTKNIVYDPKPIFALYDTTEIQTL